jgi:tRNA A-37 threonylcarbamoyl transferase component Bud32
MITVSRSIQVFHGSRFLVEPSWRERLAAVGIAENRNWATVVGDELISSSLNVTKCYRSRLGDDSVVFFKRYVYPRKFWLEFWMRPGKSTVEAWAYRRLQELGIPTLDVLAFGEKRMLGMLTATCIVTREVPDTQELSAFAIEVWSRMPEEQRRSVYRQISQKLVQQLRTAHQHRFFHHDLKWRNILIRREGDSYTPVWIDAPRASRMPLRRKRGVIVDLSGLARIAVSLLSKYDRMRFICSYLGKERDPGEAKRLYRQVARHLGRRPPKPLKVPVMD